MGPLSILVTLVLAVDQRSAVRVGLGEQWCAAAMNATSPCAEAASVGDVPVQGTDSWDMTPQSSLAVGTAVALAANGTNCSAGQYARGVDASGAAENCTADDDVPDAGEVDDTAIAASAVDGGNGGEIADGSVTADDLGADSVSSSELDGAGVEAELEGVLDLQDLAGTLDVPSGGTGAAPGADDQLLVSDSTSAATWRTLSNGIPYYTAASNTFTAVTGGCLQDWGGAQKVSVAGTGAGVAAFGIVWPGSTACGGVSHSIQINYYRSAGSDTCTVSLEDITNGNRICSVATTSTTATNIVTCGSIGNVPAAAIILEVQSTSAGGTTCTVGGGFWLSR